MLRAVSSAAVAGNFPAGIVTSSVSLGNGTVAAPSLFFTSESNTGIYRPAANQLGIAVGGVAKFLATATGINATDIGQTTPGAGSFTTLTTSSVIALGGDTLTTANIVTMGGGTSPLIGNSQNGISVALVGTSAATTRVRGILVGVATAAAAFTTNNAINYTSGGITAGAGSTITRATGIQASNQTIGTNNAAIADNLAYTGNWFINQSGTNASLLGGPLITGVDPGGTDQLRIGGSLTINSATLLTSKTSFTDGAGVGAGTLLTAPAAGNPTKWVGLNDNGTIRYFPTW